MIYKMNICSMKKIHFHRLDVGKIIFHRSL